VTNSTNPVIDKMADKYALLIQLYCKVKGVVAWADEGKFDPFEGSISAIRRYVSEYESAVAKIEEVKSERP
jgi:hypothetical protein